MSVPPVSKKSQTFSSLMQKRETISHWNWGDLSFWSSKEWSDLQKRMQGRNLIPHPRFLFRPLITLPLEKVRVVIIGREPHMTLNLKTADGLAFSSASLAPMGKAGMSNLQKNLFDELEFDLGKGVFKEPTHGSLLKWQRQGVLLWNWSPTNISGQPGGTSDWGWDKLGKEILEMIYINSPDVIFVPWGIQDKSALHVLPKDALIIDTPGPSTIIQGNTQFSHTRPFTHINKLIERFKLGPEINWNNDF